MQDRARAAASLSRAQTSDSERLRQNYVTPGMSGQPIATLDGATRFTPNLACQKTASLLEIFAQPTSSGDIGTVHIFRDKDLDGRFESHFVVPVAVSGICANGLISCAPGTWNQCKSFAWGLDAASELTLAQVDMPALAGCYCINNSCGTNLAPANLPSVLGDLGGGIVGALTTADPRIGIAEARISGPVITYVGAQTTACSSAPDVVQTRYRAAPATIQGDAASIAATSHVFQTLAASPAGAGKAEQTRRCTIEREIAVRSWTFEDIVTVTGPIRSVESCGADCRRYRIQGDGDCSAAPPVFSASFVTAKPERLLSARIVGMGAEDWVQGRVNGAIIGSAGKRPWLNEALPSGDCAVDGTWTNSVAHGLTGQFRSGTTTVAARVRGGRTERWGYVDVEVTVDTACETAERLVDLCAGYAADPVCRLTQEEVDGVATVRNGLGTGLRPLPQTRTVGLDSCRLSLTRDFFLKDRSYRCVTDTAAASPPDLSRPAYIIDRSTETLLADRVTANDGSIATTSRPFTMPDRGSVPACEPICKTRAPKANTAAAPAGVVGASQNDPTGWDIFYHGCTAENVCPVGPGEELVSACGCLDDFPEAVVMMQTVRLAGADLVCTAASR